MRRTITEETGTLERSLMMATTADLLADSNPSQTVKYDPKSETVMLPNGLVSVAGVTVVTGGAELSCGSCMLAFGVWGTLVGLSVVSVGLWDHLEYKMSGLSHLLALGLVLLLSSLSLVAMIFLLRFLMKKRRMISRRQRAEVNLVLVNEYAEVVLKRVTV
uniref:Transmembrane protein 100 n=1 Tax=Cyprinus carpio TaxID=7962 RepID=A0A8C1V5W4_CYPCA